MTTQLTPIIDQTYTQIIKLAAPRRTLWQPEAARQLMVSLFALPTIRLGIGAMAHHIEWYIETEASDSEAVVDAIYGLYPQAHVSMTSKMHSHVGYYLFDLHTAAPFVAPLKMAEDFGRLDPLATFISALTDLASDEAVVYELSLAHLPKKYYDLGEKLITTSTVNWWNFLHPGVAVAAAATKLTGADKVDKYIPEIQKPARAKLNSPLKQIFFEIKIKATSQDRASALVERLFPALAVFERDGFNFLVSPHKESFVPVLTASEVAALWHLPTEQCQAPGIVWAASAAAPIPKSLIQQEQGIVLGTNSYQGHAHTVRLTDADRIGHVNILGRTGVGKTTLLHRMIHQDIEAGKGVAVIDPRGDLFEAILTRSIPAHREQDVVLFDTRDKDYPIGLNLLARLPGVSEDDTAGYALAVMRKMFADQWRGGRMETVLDATLRALVAVEQATIQDIPKMLLDPKFRRHVLSHVTDAATLDFWYDEYALESKSQQREFARPINLRIRRFYRDPTVRRIVCQPTSLNVRQVLDRGQIFLANLGGVPETEAETLGALLISRIQMAAMSRASIAPEQRRPFYLYIDEVQNFITTSLAVMFSEARKFGLSLVVANQYLKQLEGDTLDAIMGNVGTMLIFSVGPPDAQALSRYVKPHFTLEDLIKVDRFATVVKMQLAGKDLDAFSMQTLSPLPELDNAQEQMERIRQYSRAQYGRPKDEVDAALKQRYEGRGLDQADEAEVSYFD
ncbi:MAG: type IV secretion system DNA-binding domain-containing protein [Anaerolineae bacterium]|nr:type IV secretion system DNA-binding domain-containing protein [Anaerolineae bacterium]MCB0211075.1 type IV secretion system DNA-binding domain-containing protein [Anaerolineae bacterium]